MTYIISLGGSIIYPDKINVNFLRKFRQLILNHIRRGDRFIIVTGGGRICRIYNSVAKTVNNKVTPKELDWMGIKATKVNAELIRVIFNNQAYYKVIDNPREKLKKQKNRPVIVAGGWRPGASSDNMAVNLAKTFKAGVIINLTNIDYVCDKDPKRFKNAKPLKVIGWNKFKKIVGKKWNPGANTPFDPIASRLAERLKLSVVIIKGTDLKNLSNFLDGRKFKGTLIK